MKIPKIRKLPSGAWSCQLRINGQSISITDTDKKAVEAKAYAYKVGILKQRATPAALTVGETLTQYISSRRSVLSPSTIRGYEMIHKHRFLNLQKRPISSLSAAIVQREINAEAALCSPKTLKNAFRLVESAVVAASGEWYKTTLPQIPPHEKRYLTPEQIPVFCKAIKGEEVEAAALLALWSCRRSELLGLEWGAVDLAHRKIKIMQSAVIGSDGQLVQKNTLKNQSSARTIPIVDQLYQALTAVPEQEREGHVVKLPVEGIYKRINRICRNNGLPEVGVHGLRHSFASLAHYLNIPLKQAMYIGGWSDDHTMLKIYTHLSEQATQSGADALADFFNANENANE